MDESLTLQFSFPGVLGHGGSIVPNSIGIQPAYPGEGRGWSTGAGGQVPGGLRMLQPRHRERSM